MKDKIGQGIKPGVWIAYGHALGRCAALRIGYVLAIKEQPGRLPWLTEDRITVWGISDDNVMFHQHNPKDEWAKPGPLSKKSTLMFSDRVIVIPTEQIPKEYREMIKQVIKGN